MRASRALAALVVGAGVASAAPPRAAELPLAQSPPLLEAAERPQAIPAGATVAGVRVVGARPPPARRRAPPTPGTSVEVSTDAPDQACASVGTAGRDAFRATSVFVDRSEGVVPVRLETLRESPGGAALVVTDLWVDTASLGAQHARRVEVPLAKVATGPLGASVYAFRDAGTVQLIVPIDGSGQVQTSDGLFVSASCATLRAQLRSERGRAALVTGFFMKQTAAIDASDDQPAVAPVSVRVGLSASLSQTSRDPEPVLSVVVRALDELPAPPKPRKG